MISTLATEVGNQRSEHNDAYPFIYIEHASAQKMPGSQKAMEKIIDAKGLHML